MKRLEGYAYKAIAIMLVYLALAAIGSIIAFLLRHWVLLFLLAVAGYAVYRYSRHGELPRWLEMLVSLLPREKRSGGKDARK